MTLLQRISLTSFALFAPPAFGQFVISGSLPNGIVGQAYSAQLSSTGSPSTKWAVSAGILPPGLQLNSSGANATVAGTPTTAGTYPFTISATDPELNNQASANFQVNITGPLAITSPVVLPNAIVNLNYSFQLSASGGSPGYTWSIPPSTSGASQPPPGITLTPAGFLSGVPTKVNTQGFGFDIQVTDSANNTVRGFFSLIVQPPITFTTPSPLNTGTVNSTYSQPVVVTGGSSPYTFSIADPIHAPPGMVISSSGVLGGVPKQTGTFTFSIQVVDKFQYSATSQYQVTIAQAGPLLQVPTRSLTFSALLGGDTPPSQSLTLSAPSGSPVNYAVTVDNGTVGSAKPGWITVSPTSGSVPAALMIGASQAGLQTGKYSATIRITVPNNASQQEIDVVVTLTVSVGAVQLTALPGSLRFAARAAAPLALDQLIAISNTGGGGPVSFTAALTGGSAWITNVTPLAGRVGANSIAAMRIFINSQGLKTGFYHDTLRITTASASLDVPITLFVSDGGPVLVLSASGLRFAVRQGAGSLQTQSVNVLNLGDAGTVSAWQAQLVTGSDWLSIGTPNGTSTPLRPGSFTLTPTAGAANLTAGGHYALIRVSDPAAIDSPQYLIVVADVETADTLALPDPSPGGMFLTSSTPAQNITLNTSSTSAVPFQVTTYTLDGNAWLSATPASGTASTAAPGTISVSTSSGVVSPGVYFGFVNISMNGEVRTVTVTFLATAAPAPVAPLPAISHAAGCTPSRLLITETGLVDNFAVPAGWPATLIVQLNDDCGSPVSNGSVVATFSNGDPPISLRGDTATNLYSATWQPGTVSTEMTITVRAAIPSLSATQQYNGAVSHNSYPAPTLVPDGALHIFFSVPMAQALGAGLAPGNVAQVYGTAMATGKSQTVVPLPPEFNGTFMLIGSTEAPLFYVSDSLIDALVPFELTPNRQYSLIVSANGALTLPETIDVTPLQPGVAQFTDGTVIAQTFPSGDLISASNPAKPGQNLTIYLAGMGATNPPVQSGQPTPLQLVPTVNQPVVTLDGQKVDYGYAGLTPTGVGLYQINLTVPLNARTGNLDLVVTQNGVAANTTKLPVSAQ